MIIGRVRGEGGILVNEQNSACKRYESIVVLLYYIILRPLPQSPVHSKTQATRCHAVKNAWLRFWTAK